MAELVAIGTTTVVSADFTLTDGQSTTLFLKDADSSEVDPRSVALVQIKSANDQYYTIGVLDLTHPARVLQAPGTFRVLRYTSAAAFGVDRS